MTRIWRIWTTSRNSYTTPRAKWAEERNVALTLTLTLIKIDRTTPQVQGLFECRTNTIWRVQPSVSRAQSATTDLNSACHQLLLFCRSTRIRGSITSWEDLDLTTLALRTGRRERRDRKQWLISRTTSAREGVWIVGWATTIPCRIATRAQGSILTRKTTSRAMRLAIGILTSWEEAPHQWSIRWAQCPRLRSRRIPHLQRWMVLDCRGRCSRECELVIFAEI